MQVKMTAIMPIQYIKKDILEYIYLHTSAFACNVIICFLCCSSYENCLLSVITKKIRFTIFFCQERTFLCYDDENYISYAKFSFYPYGLMISCIFLTVTLLVYLLLPKVFNDEFNLVIKIAMIGVLISKYL